MTIVVYLDLIITFLTIPVGDIGEVKRNFVDTMFGALSITFSIVGCIACSAGTVSLLRYYARPETPKRYLAAVCISWWLGITSILVLLPLDLSATVHVSRSAASKDSSIVQSLWRMNYWITFIWCWVVCPIVMEYWAAGEFVAKDKLRAAFKSNLRFYAYATVIVVVLAIVVALSKGFWPSQLAAYLIAATNCYGMLLITVMIGYGIVEIPRMLWIRSQPRKRLRMLEFSAVVVHGTMLDAKADLEQDLREFYRFERAARSSQSLDAEHLKLVLEKADEICSALSLDPNILLSTSGINGNAVPDISEKALAKLHYVLKQASVKYDRSRAEWDNILQVTAELEAVISNAEEVNESEWRGPFTRLASNSQDDAAPDARRNWLHSVKPDFGAWKVNARNIVLRLFAVVCAASSLVLLWCECVAPFNENLSVYAVVLHEAQSSFAIQILSFLPLAYMAACAYLALFKFKLLDKLALYGNQQTDVYFLLYNACYFGRLQFSLGLNYLSMLQPEDSYLTAFSALVGDIDVVPVLGAPFNNYVPLLLVAFALSTVFKVYDRLMNKLGVEIRTDPVDGLLAHEDQINQGKEQIARARRIQTQRQARGSSRRSNNPGRRTYELNRI